MDGRAGPHPLRWPWVLAGIYAVAAPLRLMLLDGPLYGDEAVQYALSRHWGADPGNVFPLYELNRPLWWGRMMFPLVLSPGAALGLDAFRLEHALLASFLPVLVAAVVRRAGASPWVAGVAGLAAAVHPSLVLWGARVFPDTVMACFVLAGLLAFLGGRHVLAAGLFVAAVWTKETAGLSLAALFAWTLWNGRKDGQVGLWPLHLDRPSTALFGAGVLAPWPLLYSVIGLQGRIPGWSHTPLEWSHLSGLFASAWLVPPILLGLVWRRSRPWSLLALAYPAFYVGYGLTGRGIEAWYLVLPATLALVGAAVGLDTAFRQAAPAWRSAARAGAAAVVLVMLVLALVPDTVAAKQAATPGASPPMSLPQMSSQLRGDDLAETLDAIRPAQWESVLLIDVGWFNVHHPFAERAEVLGWSYSVVDLPMEEWAYAIETSQVTVLLKVDDGAFNLAIRAAYADCVQFENPSYQLIDGTRCPGRADRLGQEARRQEMG